MQYTPLPFKKEFLLELTNNNYSQETVDNYERDLNFFESFLFEESLGFMQVDKLSISKYKGFLRNGEHLKALTRMLDHNLAEKSEKDLKDMGLDPEPTAGQDDSEESSSKAPKSDYKKQVGLSSRSVNRMLSSLRGYLKFLVDIDKDVPLPADAIKMLKTERKESQVAELNDLIKLIESPYQFETHPNVRARNRAMLELLFSSGMRISELINLNREDLNLYTSTGDFGIAGKLYIKGKGKKSRFVYLTERCKYWLDSYLQTRGDQYPALFIPYRGGRAGTKDPSTVRISTNYLQERIANYRRRLGIVVPTSAHSLRHGFATYIAQEGANPAAIQKLLGHESLQTTTKYVHASDKFAEEAHRKYHPVQEVKDELNASQEPL
jgi:site-specific recombinase XerD